MTDTAPAVPRKKAPKLHPKLPLSAFSPPNSSASESFPIPPSPTTVYSEKVIDGNAILSASASAAEWKNGLGPKLGGRISGAVLNVSSVDDLEHLKSSAELITGVIVPFKLEGADKPSLPTGLPFPVSFSAVFAGAASDEIDNLKGALQTGRPVDIDVRSLSSDTDFETFEDLIFKSTESPAPPNAAPIVVTNFVPPPHDLELPIVKLMSDPEFRAFQTRTAALSLFPQIHIKVLPPSWGAPVPSSASGEEGDKQKKEWKRRIKMYIGPVLEALGFQRIIFGSASAAQDSTGASDWYELLHEAFAELGVEQDAIDAVFFDNAKRVYGAS